MCTDKTSTSTAASAGPTLRAIRRSAELAAIAIVLFAAPARAEPQISVGLTLGGGAANLRTTPLPVFHMGVWGDAMFLRKRDRDMAIGPYIEVMTVAFETFEAGGGVSWLIPVTEHVPLVLSAGVHARGYPGGWEPGVHARIWMGSRSYNFDSIYGLSAGFFVEGRWGLGDGQQADILGGVQIDFELFALPFVLLYNAFR